MATLLAWGCGQPTVDTVTPRDARTTPNLVADERIQTDGNLGRIAAVTEISESRVGDRLKVQVELRNTTKKLARIGYRFEWFDEQGTLIRDPKVTWRTLTLSGGETQWASAVARSNKAVDFQLKLMRAR